VISWDRIDAARARWNVLEHPFYVAWSEGTLTRAALAAYSGQYRHAVVALAAGSSAAAERASGPLRDHLEAHAREEASHVALWDDFVQACAGDPAAQPLPTTTICVDAWTGSDRMLAPSLAALYAIEAAQPAISEVKCDGLLELYGFERGAATRYFDVHSTRDHEHAAAHREWLERIAEPGDDDALAGAVESALEGNWRLLDGMT